MAHCKLIIYSFHSLTIKTIHVDQFDNLNTDEESVGIQLMDLSGRQTNDESISIDEP
jgi:hypothetical protein